MLRKILALILVGLGFVTLGCTKKKDDNQSAGVLLLGAATIVPETGPGCNRKEKKCVISLLAGKTWYMVGSAQQPKNLLGFQESVVNTYSCYNATKAEITTGSGGNDLVFTVSNRLGSVTGSGTCDRDTPSGGYGTPTTSDFNTITPVNEDCFDIDIKYGTIIQQGRGFVNKDGTEFKLEVYRSDNADPAGHRCANGAVGERNPSLTPKATSCTTAFYVCNPSDVPTYNNVQVYDLTE